MNRRWLAMTVLVLLLSYLLQGCEQADRKTRITLWHQMSTDERGILEDLIDEYNAAHPDVQVVSLYRETEELRSSFQAAALAGAGPELVHGPSDQIGPFQTMGIIQPMEQWLSANVLESIIPEAQTWMDGHLLQIGDRIGNHLALVYNKDLLPEPPRTLSELVARGKELTVDTNNDGKPDQYGLVWNFTEPYFFVPFLTGFGGRLMDEQFRPDLNTQGAVNAFKFVRDLRDVEHIVPAECDYNMADAMFKDGRAAMLINGDWSWNGYREAGINMGIAPLPVVEQTGRPMGPLVSPRGFSLNANTDAETARKAMDFVAFMMQREVQLRSATALKILPTNKDAQNDPALQADPIIVNSLAQMANGIPMPIVAELRAVWDAMRPSYQAVLGGSVTPEQAAVDMQKLALAKIEEMNRVYEPGNFGKYFNAVVALLFILLIAWQRQNLLKFLGSWRQNRLAYLFILPAFLVIFATILYPFFYNIVLSLSNMSLKHFQDWQVVGFQNYVQVFSEPIFYTVLLKTIIWTFVNLVFHVSLGVALALVLNRYLPGKGIYRILLILPWAIPQYITALTWRGMFNYEYGAINLVINNYLQMPLINWLGSPVEAFTACILTNIWLGFPFMMVIALGGLQAIPQSLYEAAEVDGASRFRQFFSITLPLLKPVMTPAIVLGIIWTFNNLNIIWLVSNGGEPSDQTHILVSYVYKAAFNLYRYGYAAALSMVIFLILLVFNVFVLKRSRSTEAVY